MSSQRESVVSTPQIQSSTNDMITPSPLVAQNAQQKRRTRNRTRLAIRSQNDPTRIIINFFQGKQSNSPNTLGKVLMHHQRVAQKLRYEPGSKVLKQRLTKIKTIIRNMKKLNVCSSQIKAKQVYQFLEQQFATCPWPIPPSAILMALPIQEIDGKRTREQVLRRIIKADKKWRHVSELEFRDTSPYPKTL